MSPAVFQQLADLGVGELSISWSFMQRGWSPWTASARWHLRSAVKTTCDFQKTSRNVFLHAIYFYYSWCGYGIPSPLSHFVYFVAHFLHSFSGFVYYFLNVWTDTVDANTANGVSFNAIRNCSKVIELIRSPRSHRIRDSSWLKVIYIVGKQNRKNAR